MHGVNCNSRKGPDWAPDSSKFKTASEVQKDMYPLKGITGGARQPRTLVCSETIYRKEISADTTINYMNETRSCIRSRGKSTPVTIAEAIDLYTTTALRWSMRCS
ncbi:glycoside hydrolase 3 protein [Phytophthora pseudosyringae]|uniref:glucan endo-1,3-beta-D-glucosidase n=1 Tax=Phytophthora pseudosyringae TaxID=221518 RepID=A0A8T1VT27_9STRA|nr:glycoside hydrolase 3 protein [Phytophthora pseudosyringae]